MSVADIAIGLTLEDDDYVEKLNNADKQIQRLDRHRFLGLQAGAKKAGKEIDGVGQKLTRIQKLTAGADKIAKKAGWVAFGAGAVSAATGAMAAFSRMRVHQIKELKAVDAEHAKMLTKWEARTKKFEKVHHVSGAISAGALGAAFLGKLGGGVGRLFGGGVPKAGGAAGGGAGSRGMIGSMAAGGGGLMAAAAGGVVGALAAGAAAIGGAAMTGAKGISLNADLQEATASFEVFTGSAAKAKAMVAGLKTEADKTPFDTAEVIATGSSLVSIAGKSQKKLMDLVKTAEMLTVLNPNKAAGGGLESAAIAIKNAESGDTTSLQDRFNIAPAQMQKFKDQGLQGAELIRAVLKDLNVTEASVDRMGSTFRGRMSTIMSFVDTLMAKLTGPVFGWLTEKAGAAVEWISANGQFIQDVVGGLGVMMLEKMKTVGTWIAGKWAAIQVGIAFIEGLPDRLAAGFNNGALGNFLTTLLGAGLTSAWNGIKLIGGLIWEGIVTGVPLLTVIAGKMIVDGLKNTLGPRLTKMLGLEKISEKLGEAAAGGTQMLKDSSKERIAKYIGDTKDVFSTVGFAGKQFVQDTGGAPGAATMPGGGLLARAAAIGGAGRQEDTAANAQKKAARLAALNAEQQSILSKAGGSRIGAMQATGQIEEARRRYYADIAAIDSGGGDEPAAAPRRAAAPNKAAQAAETYNAKAQMRPARNLKADAQHLRVTLTSQDGHINPVAGTVS